MKLIYILLSLFWFTTTACYPLDYTRIYQADCINVIDGDTIVTKQGVHIRLACIDCPEHNQPSGNAAALFTAYYCLGKHIVVEEIDHDRYGRTVAYITPGILKYPTFPPASSANHGYTINAALVVNGLAWVYPQYCHELEFYKMENAARHEHLGLWAANHPIPPWVWRHGG